MSLSNVTLPDSAGKMEPKATYQAERIPETHSCEVEHDYSAEDIRFNEVQLVPKGIKSRIKHDGRVNS